MILSCSPGCLCGSHTGQHSLYAWPACGPWHPPFSACWKKIVKNPTYLTPKLHVCLFKKCQLHKARTLLSTKMLCWGYGHRSYAQCETEKLSNAVSHQGNTISPNRTYRVYRVQYDERDSPIPNSVRTWELTPLLASRSKPPLRIMKKWVIWRELGTPFAMAWLVERRPACTFFLESLRAANCTPSACSTASDPSVSTASLERYASCSTPSLVRLFSIFSEKYAGYHIAHIDVNPTKLPSLLSEIRLCSFIVEIGFPI